MAGPQHQLRQGAQRTRRDGTRRSRGARSVEVRARSSFGDITIRRSRREPRSGGGACNERASAVQVVGLRKSFGDKVVLDGIDLEIAEGTVFALLGPNGAGKTTTVQILSTLIRADAGDIQRRAASTSRREPQAFATRSASPDSSRRWTTCSPAGRTCCSWPISTTWTGVAGRRRVDELLARFDLVDAAGQIVMKYSGGMRRRLDLAMTLIGEPRIIFLDEPTTGLDPRSRHTMWQITRELVAGGVTVLLTTQNLDEADELADRIARPRPWAAGRRGHARIELKRRIPGGRVRLHFREPRMRRASPRACSGTRHSTTRRSSSTFPPTARRQSLRSLLDQARRAGPQRRERHRRDAGSRRRVLRPDRRSTITPAEASA